LFIHRTGFVGPDMSHFATCRTLPLKAESQNFPIMVAREKAVGWLTVVTVRETEQRVAVGKEGERRWGERPMSKLWISEPKAVSV
jgi:hypothetical protein